MKVALCMRGKVGNTQKYVLGKQSMDVANIGFKHWKENLLDHNDVDVFWHCWDKQFKDDLIEMSVTMKYDWARVTTTNPSAAAGGGTEFFNV